MALSIFRSRWSKTFPKVVVHGDLRSRDRNPAYAPAKSGDREAAMRLVTSLVDAASIENIAHILAGRKPQILAVTADEVGGYNAIPDAFAQTLGEILGLQVAAGRVAQANKVGHTKADGWHRLVTPAVFDGEVLSGMDYVLVDDHVGFGGTLANLRGFVEHLGGSVICMTTLTETRDARQIAIRDETLHVLKGKHGYQLEHLWRGIFGHGLECLTDIEAGYLRRAESVAAIQSRMAEAAELAYGRGLSAIAL